MATSVPPFVGCIVSALSSLCHTALLVEFRVVLMKFSAHITPCKDATQSDPELAFVSSNKGDMSPCAYTILMIQKERLDIRMR